MWPEVTKLVVTGGKKLKEEDLHRTDPGGWKWESLW